MSIKFKSNLDLVLRTMRGNNSDAAKKAADVSVEAVREQMIYGYSELHGKPPHTEIWETGTLFDSIRAEIRHVSQNVEQVTVGSDEPYAKYVHDGTRKLTGRPYITDGLQNAKDDLREEVGNMWKRGF